MNKTPRILSPFDKPIEILLLDEKCQPVALSTLNDVQIVFCMNRCPKIKFKKIAATGWQTWVPGEGDEPTSVICALTTDNTINWRGLLTAEVVQIAIGDDGANEIPREVLLNLVSISNGFTPPVTPVVNPITFTLAFSCSTDGNQTLTFTANANAPNGNYIVQILIEGTWRRLYKGYIQVTNGVGDANGTGSYTLDIAKLKQVAAGTYTIRLLNDATGATSDEQELFIADCWQGQERNQGNYLDYMNGLFATWGWY